MRAIAGALRTALAIVCGALLAACTAPQTTALLGAKGDLPRSAAVADVPFYPQEDYYCGPAALAMVLTWSGDNVTQHDLVSEVYTPARQGTFRSDVLGAARRHGRLAVTVDDVPDLLRELAAGHPVIVFQNLALDWWPQWHFAVAYGYHLGDREIVLRSGQTESLVTNLDTFERTWARGDYWGLVVLPPDRLPASADAHAVLQAAVALERTHHFAAAEQTYEAILERWPDSFPAHMGLGNTRYAQDRHAQAVTGFRDAIALRADAPSAWNNLAYALAAQGQSAKAREAARKAVRLAPGDGEAYRATLAELSEQRSARE